MVNRAKYVKQFASNLNNAFTSVASTAADLYTKEATSQANLALEQADSDLKNRYANIVNDYSLTPEEMESVYNDQWDDLLNGAVESVSNRKAKEIVSENLRLQFESQKGNLLIAQKQRQADNATAATMTSLTNYVDGYKAEDNPDEVIGKAKKALGYNMETGELESPVMSRANTEQALTEFKKDVYRADAELSINALLESDTSALGQRGYNEAKQFVEENEYGFGDIEKKELKEYVDSEYSKALSRRNTDANIAAENTAVDVRSRLESAESASDIWKGLEQDIDSLPPYMQQKVKDSASAAMVEWATEKSFELYIDDKDKTVKELKDQRRSIASGTLYNTTFYKSPQVRKQLVDTYDSMIAAKEKNNAAAVKAQTEMIVDENKSRMNITYQRYLTGELTAEEAVKEIAPIGSETETLEDDEYGYELAAAINKDIRETAEDSREEAVEQRKHIADVTFNKYKTGQLTKDEAEDALNDLMDADNNTAEDESYISNRIVEISEDSEKRGEERVRKISEQVQDAAELTLGKQAMGALTYEDAADQLLELAENVTTLEDMKYVQEALIDAETQAVKENKTFADTIYSSLTAGRISPNQAVKSLNNAWDNTRSMEDDSYVEELITKIKDNVIPPKYKKHMESFMDRMDVRAWGLDVPQNKTTGAIEQGKLTEEQQDKLNESRASAETAILDLLMSTPAEDMTISEFNDELNEIGRNYTSERLDTVSSIDINEGIFKDPAIDLVKSNQELAETQSVIYDENSGNYEWASKETKEAFDKVSGQFRNELESHGVEITSPAVPLFVNGKAYPTPVYRGKESDGRFLYAIDRDEIFASPAAVKGSNYAWSKKWMVTEEGGQSGNTAEPPEVRTDIDKNDATFTGSDRNKGTSEYMINLNGNIYYSFDDGETWELQKEDSKGNKKDTPKRVLTADDDLTEVNSYFNRFRR